MGPARSGQAATTDGASSPGRPSRSVVSAWFKTWSLIRIVLSVGSGGHGAVISLNGGWDHFAPADEIVGAGIVEIRGPVARQEENETALGSGGKTLGAGDGPHRSDNVGVERCAAPGFSPTILHSVPSYIRTWGPRWLAATPHGRDQGEAGIEGERRKIDAADHWPWVKFMMLMCFAAAVGHVKRIAIVAEGHRAGQLADGDRATNCSLLHVEDFQPVQTRIGDVEALADGIRDHISEAGGGGAHINGDDGVRETPNYGCSGRSVWSE